MVLEELGIHMKKIECRLIALTMYSTKIKELNIKTVVSLVEDKIGKF